METFLAVLLALGIYVVIPVLIGLFICTVAILYDRRFHKVKQNEVVEETQQILLRKPSEEKVKDTVKVG